MITVEDFVLDLAYKEELEELITVSNLALKNWDINWTGFMEDYIFQDFSEQLKKLSDISFFSHGGYENSSRVKVACFRKSLTPSATDLTNSFPGMGIDIRGNFLFDNANQSDFRDFISQFNLSKKEIGDIWTLRDKGAQGIISKKNFTFANQNTYFLRDVETKLKIVSLDELNKPIIRTQRFINSVEASLRLDAIASAGFRMSRNKICDRIKNGLLSLNGKKTNKSTISVKIGDKIRLENKGLVEILEIEKTKRERWKIKLIKK